MDTAKKLWRRWWFRATILGLVSALIVHFGLKIEGTESPKPVSIHQAQLTGVNLVAGYGQNCNLQALPVPGFQCRVWMEPGTTAWVDAVVHNDVAAGWSTDAIVSYLAGNLCSAIPIPGASWACAITVGTALLNVIQDMDHASQQQRCLSWWGNFDVAGQLYWWDTDPYGGASWVHPYPSGNDTIAVWAKSGDCNINTWDFGSVYMFAHYCDATGYRLIDAIHGYYSDYARWDGTYYYETCHDWWAGCVVGQNPCLV